MKNKGFLILSLTALSILAGCGENNSSVSDSSTSYRDADGDSSDRLTDSSTTDSSKVDSSKDDSSSTSSSSSITIDSLDSLFTNLKSYKVDVVNQKYTLSYYGKYAYYLDNVNYQGTTMESYEPYKGGMFATEDNGTWSFDIKEGTYDKFSGTTSADEFELGSCQYGTKVDFTEYSSYYKPLTTFLKSASIWEKVAKPDVSGAVTQYAIRDESSSKASTLLEDLPSLARYFDGYTYATDGTSAEITESEGTSYKASDAQLCFMKNDIVYLYFKIYTYENGVNSKKGVYGRVYLKNIGTASNTLLDGFLAAPTFTPPTAWTTDEDTSFNNVLGESLPFMTGLSAGHAFASDTNAYGDEYEAIVTDVLCGETVATTYKTSLSNAGWTGTDVNMGDSSYGFNTKYTKNGKIVNLMYLSKAYFTAYDTVEGTSYASMYPKGQVVIDACMYDSSSLTSIKDSYIDKYVYKTNADGSKSDYIPDFDFGEVTPDDLAFLDYTAVAQASYGNTVKCFYYITGTFTTAENALAALKTYATKLTAAGFINTASTESEPETLVEALTSDKIAYATLKDSSFSTLTLNSIAGLHIIMGYGTGASSTASDPGYFRIQIAG